MSENIVSPVSNGLVPVTMEIICGDELTSMFLKRPEDSEPYSASDSRLNDPHSVIRMAEVLKRMSVGNQPVDMLTVSFENSGIAEPNSETSLLTDELANRLGMGLQEERDYHVAANLQLIGRAACADGRAQFISGVGLGWNDGQFSAVRKPSANVTFHRSRTEGPKRYEAGAVRPTLYLFGRKALESIPSLSIPPKPRMVSEAVAA